MGDLSKLVRAFEIHTELAGIAELLAGIGIKDEARAVELINEEFGPRAFPSVVSIAYHIQLPRGNYAAAEEAIRHELSRALGVNVAIPIQHQSRNGGAGPNERTNTYLVDVRSGESAYLFSIDVVSSRRDSTSHRREHRLTFNFCITDQTTKHDILRAYEHVMTPAFYAVFNTMDARKPLH